MNKTKYEIKLRCFRDRKLETCADCTDYPCRILEAFWGKNGWKYRAGQKTTGVYQTARTQGVFEES